MSFHNHLTHFSPQFWAMVDEISLADPKFGDPVPRQPEEPGAFFRAWLAGEVEEGETDLEFFGLERSFWAERRRPNVLLVHYNDLKADRAEEMRRIAGFLGVEVPEPLWPRLVEAAGFDAMKRHGDALIPKANDFWEGGASRFLHKGTNGRWRDHVAAEDLARYEARVAAELSPGLARWLEHGRRLAGDPRALAE